MREHYEMVMPYSRPPMSDQLEELAEEQADVMHAELSALHPCHGGARSGCSDAAAHAARCMVPGGTSGMVSL